MAKKAKRGGTTSNETMQAEIVLFRDCNRCWRWHITAANGEILAHSESYASKQKAKQTARRLSDATGLPIIE